MISWPWNEPKLYRHGDLLIKQVKKIPEYAQQLSTNIIAHGENGNTHKLHGSHQVYGTHSSQNYRVIEPTYFQAKEEISLKHEEHSTLKISKGNYGIIQEREFEPFKNIEQEVID